MSLDVVGLPGGQVCVIAVGGQIAPVLVNSHHKGCIVSWIGSPGVKNEPLSRWFWRSRRPVAAIGEAADIFRARIRRK